MAHSKRQASPALQPCPQSIKAVFPNAYLCDDQNGVYFQNFLTCASDMQDIAVVDQYCQWGACPAGIQAGQKCYNTPESQPCTCVGADCKCAPYIPNVDATATLSYTISGNPGLSTDTLLHTSIPAMYAFCARGQTGETDNLYQVECG